MIDVVVVELISEDVDGLNNITEETNTFGDNSVTNSSDDFEQRPDIGTVVG